MHSFSSVIVMLNVVVSIWLVTHIDRFLRSHVMKNKTDTFEGHLNWEMRLFFSFLFDCFLCWLILRCTNYFENRVFLWQRNNLFNVGYWNVTLRNNLESHCFLLEDNNTQQAKTCKNVDFCQGFPWHKALRSKGLTFDSDS